MVDFWEFRFETIVQLILALATIALVFITWRNTKKIHNQTEVQLKLTQKEIDSRLRAVLHVNNIRCSIVRTKEGNVQGAFLADIVNLGMIPATNVQLHFNRQRKSVDIRSLIQDEDEIKRASTPIKGSVTNKQPATFEKRTIPLDEEKPFDIAMWITYDYADVKNHEVIYIYKIMGGNTFNPIAIYEHEDIQSEKNAWRKLNRGETFAPT